MIVIAIFCLHMD